MATIDTNLVTALGAGSGVDVKSLAQSLVDAEKAPREAMIQDKIDKSEAKISGYSAMMATLNVLKEKFSALSLNSSFSSLTVSNSQPSVASISTSAATAVGRYSMEVQQLARGQVSEMTWDHDANAGTDALTGFSSAEGGLGTGAFDFTLAYVPERDPATQTISIAADQRSPEGIVEAINAASEENDLGIQARLVDTGASTNRYKVVVSGGIGAANEFTLTSSTGLNFSVIDGQEAQDAEVVMDGVNYTRATNVLSDLIPGATVTLTGTNTGSPSTLEFTRDTSEVKQKLKDIVSAYNDVVNDLGILSGPKSDDEEDIFSGSLQGDSTVRQIKTQVRNMLFGDSKTPSGEINSLFDLGVTVDRNGVASLDEEKFDTVFAESFDDVVQAISGTVVDGSTVTRGIAGSAVSSLTSLLSPTGTIVTQSQNAANTVSRYEEDLEELNTRMETLLARYTKQFAVMESIVGEITSTRESLKGTFESLAAAYNNS